MCLSCNWILQEVTKIHEVLWMLSVLRGLHITWGFPIHIRLLGKKPFIRYTNKYIMYMTECIGERKVYYIWSFISLCVCVCVFQSVLLTRVKLVPLRVSDLYRLVGDTVNEAEGYRMHTTFSQSLLKDHFQSSQLQEHGLIQVRFLARFSICAAVLLTCSHYFNCFTNG